MAATKLLRRRKANKIPRPVVEWKDRSAPPPKMRMPPYIWVNRGGDLECYPALAAVLTPGAAFYLKFPVKRYGTSSKDEYDYVHPPVGYSLQNDAMPKGTLAMYVGTVHSEERKGNDKNINMVRHIFFIKDGVYIVSDFSLIDVL